MRPILDAYGVSLVAISKDTIEQAAGHRLRDNLSSFMLLSDPDLDVIQAYGLVHQKGFRFHTLFLGSFPLGWPVGFDRMAIPTSLLIDEDGRVCWIDQAEDYRLRGDAGRIERALAAVFEPLDPEEPHV